MWGGFEAARISASAWQRCCCFNLPHWLFFLFLFVCLIPVLLFGNALTYFAHKDDHSSILSSTQLRNAPSLSISKSLSDDNSNLQRSSRSNNASLLHNPVLIARVKLEHRFTWCCISAATWIIPIFLSCSSLSSCARWMLPPAQRFLAASLHCFCFRCWGRHSCQKRGLRKKERCTYMP